MAKAVGIDLGSTNSVSAVLEGGRSPSSSRTPKAGAPAVRGRLRQVGRGLVGEVAKRQAITNPDRTIRSVNATWYGLDVDIDGKDYTPRRFSAPSSAN